MKIRTLLMAGAVMAAGWLQGAELYSAKFMPGQWQSSQWDMVKSWRWDYAGQWIQNPDHIINQIPADATPQEMLSKRAGETYTSMLLKQSFAGNLTISCEMSFDYRMAPGIMIAAEPVKDAKGRWEYRDHFEVILFDEGINVWHHYFVNGKQQWAKKSFLTTKFKANQRYRMTVQVQFTHRGPQLTLQVGDHKFGYLEPALPKQFRIGLVGCEGANRFYDFQVTTPEKKK